MLGGLFDPDCNQPLGGALNIVTSLWGAAVFYGIIQKLLKKQW